MTKGCYTCRRRRITCDNGLPTCRKCRDAGKECLGYQKPLVWVKGGVASRGKMMGRSFNQVMPPPPAQAEQETSAESTSTSIPTAQPPPGEDGQPEESMAITTQHNPSSLATRVPKPLVDPLFKDLSPLPRFYISHCELSAARKIYLV